MTDFWSMLRASLERGTFVSFVLSRKLRADADIPDKITVRPVTIKGETRLQWSLRHGAKELHENLSALETLARAQSLLGTSFGDCHLFTTDADYAARIDASGALTVRQSPATKQPAVTTHDRTKAYLIPEGVPCPFLAEIGVMTPAGQVRKAKYAKFRQINRFLELVEDAVSALPASGTLHVVDFGCGKSYLTFALHHLLSVVHGRTVKILGLDRNRDVVESCAHVAARLGLKGVAFQVGDIANCTVDFPVDLAVSLHACDTATDDALARAVDWQASVILAVPCCQHELAERIHAPSLETITRHGILKERFAALATDALRAAALEACGYKVQVVEFIDMEHTPKNLLIRAVRRPQGETVPSGRAGAYHTLKETLGLGAIHLEEVLPPEMRKRLDEESVFGC